MPARLLIVDDHEVVRLGVRTLFANNDSLAICGEAQNGMEAIRMVSEMSPDVVILDLSMQGMNGFEIATRIRLIAPSTRIVFFSFHEIPSSARLAGADAFVSKSSPLRELALTVDRVLQPGRREEFGAARTSRESSYLGIGAPPSSARAYANDSGMRTESAERRHQPRSNSSQTVRIRPFDSSLLPDDCTTFNVSQNGLYFVTSKGHYLLGMNVYVTCDWQPDKPMDHAVVGVVTRMEKRDDDKWGVAIHIFSQLSPLIQ
jgi:DNA-binding NarL/FixJ family response regulator